MRGSPAQVDAGILKNQNNEVKGPQRKSGELQSHMQRGQVHVFGHGFTRKQRLLAEKWTRPRTLQFS